MTSSRCSRAFTLWLFVCALVACGIRQDEFDCENAAAHLQECCPGFRASMLSCTYSSQGCSTTFPELAIADSDCIRDASCDYLRTTGVCDRVMPSTATLSSGSPDSRQLGSPVCGPAVTLYVPSEDAGAGEGIEASIGCLGVSDCAGGLGCCSQFGATATGCAPLPCASGYQACIGSSECAAGQTCSSWLVAGVRFCEGAGDASADAESETAVSEASKGDSDASDAQRGDDAEGIRDGGTPDSEDTQPPADALADVGGQ
jgi:hypothetical protein